MKTTPCLVLAFQSFYPAHTLPWNLLEFLLFHLRSPGHVHQVRFYAMDCLCQFSCFIDFEQGACKRNCLYFPHISLPKIPDQAVISKDRAGMDLQEKCGQLDQPCSYILLVGGRGKGRRAHVSGCLLQPFSVVPNLSCTAPPALRPRSPAAGMGPRKLSAPPKAVALGRRNPRSARRPQCGRPNPPHSEILPTLSCPLAPSPMPMLART